MGATRGARAPLQKKREKKQKGERKKKGKERKKDKKGEKEKGFVGWK